VASLFFISVFLDFFHYDMAFGFGDWPCFSYFDGVSFFDFHVVWYMDCYFSISSFFSFVFWDFLGMFPSYSGRFLHLVGDDSACKDSSSHFVFLTHYRYLHLFFVDLLESSTFFRNSNIPRQAILLSTFEPLSAVSPNKGDFQQESKTRPKVVYLQTETTLKKGVKQFPTYQEYSCLHGLQAVS